jgi:aryl-alcohol dehydrogenase-like predicted oxidoreductase
MDATIRIPNVGHRTTPLGVGLATLMREPSPRIQQRLLHAAFDAGFRHFDVAPSYGLGRAESALGVFLRTKPGAVTVGTKVGITAKGGAGLVRMIERPARALLRRFPGLRGRATRTVGTAVHAPPDFSPENRTRSLENSLRALGVERIDLLLLHDVEPRDLVGGSVIDWLQEVRARGAVASVGIATSAAAAAAILAQHHGVFDVVQTPSSVLSPAGKQLHGSGATLRVSHSVLARPLAAAQKRMASDDAWLRELSLHAGADVSRPGELAKLLLALGIAENEGGIILVGASQENHLRSAPRALRAYGAERLAAAARFVRETLSE